MHECIYQLLGGVPPSQEDIESVCKLLTTIGKHLDHPAAKPYMDKYFARMEDLSKSQKLPSRLRFMLQDVRAFSVLPLTVLTA